MKKFLIIVAAILLLVVALMAPASALDESTYEVGDDAYIVTPDVEIVAPDIISPPQPVPDPVPVPVPAPKPVPVPEDPEWPSPHPDTWQKDPTPIEGPVVYSTEKVIYVSGLDKGDKLIVFDGIRIKICYPDEFGAVVIHRDNQRLSLILMDQGKLRVLATRV
jgi:hypothetical protein